MTRRAVALLYAFLLAFVFLGPRIAFAQAPPKKKHGFWEMVLDPHAQEIAALLEEARPLMDRAAQYYEVHQLHEKRKLLAEALVRYERASALAPDRVDLLYGLGSVAFDAGEWGKAADAFSRYRDLVPGDQMMQDTIRRLAFSLIKVRRWNEASEVLKRSLDSQNLRPEERAHISTLLGYVYMSEGSLEDAIDAFTRGSTISYGYGVGYGYASSYPNNPALNGLAVAYDRDEQLGRAAEVLEQLRALDPNFSHLSYLSGPYQMIPFSPNSDRHYWLGLAYEVQQRFPEAAAEWRAYLESADPMYRARAEEHLRLVQQELQKQTPGKKGKRGKGRKAP